MLPGAGERRPVAAQRLVLRLGDPADLDTVDVPDDLVGVPVVPPLEIDLFKAAKLRRNDRATLSDGTPLREQNWPATPSSVSATRRPPRARPRGTPPRRSGQPGAKVEPGEDPRAQADSAAQDEGRRTGP